MIRDVDAVAVAEIDEMQIVNFTDRSGHAYAIYLGFYVKHMCATPARRQFVSTAVTAQSR
jgi:hypothetical protein